MSRNEDVARVLSTNVWEHVEPIQYDEMSMVAMEPLRAGPVDGAGDVAGVAEC